MSKATKVAAVKKERAAKGKNKRPAPAKSSAKKVAVKKVTRSSDAKTGRTVTKDFAKNNPDTTVTEKVKSKKSSGHKLPKTLAQAADQLYTTKHDRLAAEKEFVKPLVEFEKELKNYLIDNLPKSEANGISGKVANAKIVNKEVPTIEDEAAFMRFAKKKGNEDLLVVKPNMEAILERWDAGKAIPGVGKFTVVTVSSTKL